jgi:Tol biopolymer transport system component
VTRGPGRSDLLTWSPEQGEQPLAASRREERWPAWSPVRAELAYAFVGGRPAAGLALADVASGESRVAADAGPDHLMLRPSWAPDGRRLVVQRRPREGGASQLWLIGSDGESRPLLGDRASDQTKGWFTRDGGRVVFTRKPRDGGPADVWSVGVDGSDPRLLAGGDATSEHSGRPSPTRDELAFVSDRSGSPQVWLAPLDGAPPRRLTAAPGGAYTPRWSPDGELLVVSVSQALGKPRLADRASLEGLRLLVIDRQGRRVLETAGLMADWMPAWR